MKTTIIGLLLLATITVNAQEEVRTYQLSDAPRYSEETGYGYDLTATSVFRTEITKLQYAWEVKNRQE